ncbi:hypothetical protein C8J31_105136 [Rhizobium sp. PP-CC-2G-626]|nr:hypothetical protein C8J31_105136 [Rhizobium sp. PP-CC-2G-626]
MTSALPSRVQQTEAVQMSADTLAEEIITSYNGDHKAALKSVLADSLFFQSQLHTASCLLSKGMGRGWTPAFERIPVRES